MSDPGGRIDHVRIAMLGPLEVSADDGSPVDITGARLRALLILLALAPGRTVTPERLIDGVWAERPPAEALNALQALVSRLRRALPEPVVESGPAGYRLAIPPESTDVHRFETLAASGRVREALDLWRGEALADVGGAAFARAPRARLDELRLGALGDRIERDLAAGDRDLPDLVAELESLVAEHPLRERFAGLLMRTLTQAGRSGDALAVHARIRDALADELGADPSPELADLHLEVLRGERGAAPERQHTNLRAALTSFVGRDTDLERVTALVGESRLVTLTGPGGSGKTRLATEVARGLLASLGDVWFVELAPVDGADLPQTVLTTLGLRAHNLLGHSGTVVGEPVDRLAAALSTRPLLLVLDNCEHVVEAAAALADRLLGECLHLRILATSREPLGITGETLWPVDPLPLPPDGAGREDAMAYPSMRLLADRARSVRPSFQIDDATAATMARICRALDGMPLAIELAAARLRTMSPEQVATRLDDRFRLLTGGSRMALPRHQTLRAVVDWSWDLLDDAERTLLRRLAVFAGGATLEAAEQVCAGEDLPPEQVLDVLSALVDKSLVVLVGDRYRLLETIKAYGLERLAQAGEQEAARHAHLEHFRGLLETAEPHLLRAEQVEWLGRLEADQDNLTAALRGAVAAGDAENAMRMLANVGWYWWLRGNKIEGAELANEVLSLPVTGLPDEVVAQAYGLAALIALDGPRAFGLARTWFVEAVEYSSRADSSSRPLLRLMAPLDEVFRDNGWHSPPQTDKIDALCDDEDPWVRGTALVMRAHSALNAGHLHEAAEADFRRALAAFESIGERWGLSFTLCSLADMLAWRGELAAAVESYRDAIRLLSQLVSNEDLVRYRLKLASLLLQLDRGAEAAEALADAQRDADRSGLPESLAAVAVCRADHARRRGELEVALAELARSTTLSGHVTVAPQLRALVCTSQGYLAAADGRYRDAEAHHAEAVEWAMHSHDAPVIAEVLVGFADTSLARGEARHAAELLGASEAIRGVPDLSLVDGVRVAAAAREALGEELFAECAARGRAATLDSVWELTGLTPAV
jgi:predicted ATPase/DNA-binding SARP family transcriptional activator